MRSDKNNTTAYRLTVLGYDPKQSQVVSSKETKLVNQEHNTAAANLMFSFR
jgi:hypothetical protein